MTHKDKGTFITNPPRFAPVPGWMRNAPIGYNTARAVWCYLVGRVCRAAAGGSWFCRSLLAPPQRWDRLVEPHLTCPKPPDLAHIFAVDAARRAGYVDHNGRLALLAGGRDANGGGPWRTEVLCVAYALCTHD